MARRVWRLGLAALALAHGAAAQARPTNVKVRHCAAADSAIGRKSSAWKGDVVSSVDAAGVTHLRGAPINGKFRVIGSAKVEGQTWMEVPPLALSVFLRGKEVDGLLGLGRDPRVTVMVDDSVSLEPTAVKLGTFIGPENLPKALITLPVSTLLSPDDFLTLARGRSAYVRVEQAKIRPVASELRNIQALYAVLACGAVN